METEVRDVAKPRVQHAVLAVDLYSLIGVVSMTLRLAGLDQREREFVNRSVALGTYDEVLALSREYVQFGGEGTDTCL